MYHRKRIAQAALIAGVGLGALGGAGFVAAAGPNPATTDTTTPTEVSADATTVSASDDTADDAAEDTVDYTSSVTIADDGTRPDRAEVLALATVSAADAVDAAVADTPGTATRVGLRVEDGNVVWMVHVVDAAGETYEVAIDAGNASVLASEVDEGMGPRQGGRAGETVEYTSSVTVASPESALSEVATVSAADAISAALADTPGTVAGASLRSVGGNVVWQVGVVDEAGAAFRVTVDAGNASVLATVAGEDLEMRGGPGGDHGGPGGRGGRGGPGGERPGGDQASDADDAAATADTAADAATTTTTG